MEINHNNFSHLEFIFSDSFIEKEHNFKEIIYFYKKSLEIKALT